MKPQDTRQTLLLNTWLQFGLVILIVVFANLLGAQHFFRLDVTSDRLHSLDDASKRIAARLDRPLVIKAFFTRGLEAPYNNHEQMFRDKIEEFRAYAGDNIRFTVVDPADDPEILKEAQKYGLTPLDYTVRRADRSELRKIWMGAVLLYADRQEVLPSLTDLGSLEYDLAGAIHRLSIKMDDRKVIAFSTGHGEPDLSRPEGPLKSLMQSLAQKFAMVAVPLGGAGLIPEEVDALIIIGPQQSLPARALYQVDQFLMRGGSAGFFLMNTRPDLRTYRAVPVISGLEPLLGHYGVVVGRNILIDRVQNGSMRFPVRVGQSSGLREINYPLIPKATQLSRESVITSGLDQMIFPFASSLTLADPLPAGLRGEVLAWSSESAGALQNLPTVDPTRFGELLPGEERGPFSMLVAMTGSFRSFFETRPAPRPEEGIAATEENPQEAAMIVEGATTRLVVSGSADVVANNPAFMLNLVDWLAQDEALIGIRSKITQIPPLPATSAREQALWKGFNLLAGPALLLLYGALRQIRRRRTTRA